MVTAKLSGATSTRGSASFSRMSALERPRVKQVRGERLVQAEAFRKPVVQCRLGGAK
ncbi:hypothetical protein SALBM135S_02931 [Streptomyces alboniger]